MKKTLYFRIKIDMEAEFDVPEDADLQHVIEEQLEIMPSMGDGFRVKDSGDDVVVYPDSVYIYPNITVAGE